MPLAASTSSPTGCSWTPNFCARKASILRTSALLAYLASHFASGNGQRATLLRNSTARAYGIVMQLTHAEIEQLYAEASVRAYRPEAVLSEQADGSHVPALCFNLLVAPGPEEANSEYSAKLRDLAHRLGLPSDYVASIL